MQAVNEKDLQRGGRDSVIPWNRHAIQPYIERLPAAAAGTIEAKPMYALHPIDDAPDAFEVRVSELLGATSEGGDRLVSGAVSEVMSAQLTARRIDEVRAREADMAMANWSLEPTERMASALLAH
ncbi:hypothetical protein BH11PSE13_BH11PSE13_32230 [soil metagenome]